MPAAVSIKTEGLDKVLAALKAQTPKGAKTMTVQVGYAAPYAIYVHENLEAFHPTGQAKYLEQPTRTMMGRLRFVIAQTMLRKRGLEEALYAAASELQIESQKLVPVDTGFLRDSAFIETKAAS